MKCPECNSFVKSSLIECPSCGADLPGPKDGPKGRQEKEEPKGEPKKDGPKGRQEKDGPKGRQEKGGPKGRPKDRSKKGSKKAKIIDKRGEEEMMGMFDDEDDEPSRPKSEKHKFAGILLIFAGFDSILTAVMQLSVTSMMMDAMTFEGVYLRWYQNIYITIYVGMFLIGIIALIAGYYAFKKKNWNTTMMLTIVALFGGGFALSSTIMAIVALVLLIKNKSSFFDD